MNTYTECKICGYLMDALTDECPRCYDNRVNVSYLENTTVAHKDRDELSKCHIFCQICGKELSSADRDCPDCTGQPLIESSHESYDSIDNRLKTPKSTHRKKNSGILIIGLAALFSITILSFINIAIRKQALKNESAQHLRPPSISIDSSDTRNLSTNNNDDNRYNDSMPDRFFNNTPVYTPLGNNGRGLSHLTPDSASRTKEPFQPSFETNGNNSPSHVPYDTWGGTTDHTSTYVGGTPQMAPDGTFVGGKPQMAPDGTFVGGKPQMAPDGNWVGLGH